MAKSKERLRTTPFGLWRYGNDFRLAATYVLDHERSKYFMPYYFLLGQSIELSMKAFLLGRGVAITELRAKNLGHDLVALLGECKRRKIGKEVELSQYHGAGIRILNLTYKPRRLQYIETGLMSLPEAWMVHEAAENLSVGLESFCHKATTW